MSQDASCTELRRIAGMVVNSASTLLKGIELAKKRYGVTPENNIARPAGDLRSPHERDLQFRSCCWSGGVFLGNESESWTARPGKDRDFFLEQMGKADRDALSMRRLKSGWEQYGMPPMAVVNHKPAPQIPRYKSEPIFRSARSD